MFDSKSVRVRVRGSEELRMAAGDGSLPDTFDQRIYTWTGDVAGRLKAYSGLGLCRVWYVCNEM